MVVFKRRPLRIGVLREGSGDGGIRRLRSKQANKLIQEKKRKGDETWPNRHIPCT